MASQVSKQCVAVLWSGGSVSPAVQAVVKADGQLTTTKWPEFVHWLSSLVYCWRCTDWPLKSQRKAQVNDTGAGMD